MLGKDRQEERPYHSEEKRRSVSREESRKFKMERMKMRFRNISRQINQIKKQNSSDLNQLNNLIQSSQQLQMMANQSLEKAKLILSESKVEKKRVTSPAFHEVRHTQPVEVSDFPSLHHPPLQNKTIPPENTPGKRKGRVGKHSVNPTRIKTDETSESEAPRKGKIDRINESELFQQSSFAKESCIAQQQEEQSILKEQGESTVKPSNTPQAFKGMNNSTKFNSHISMRASIKRSAPTAPRKTESIYPYIAIIFLSIILLLSLRE